MHDNYICDKCDREATNFCRDFAEQVYFTRTDNSVDSFSIVGKIRAGCDEHPVSSALLETSEVENAR